MILADEVCLIFLPLSVQSHPCCGDPWEGNFKVIKSLPRSINHCFSIIGQKQAQPESRPCRMMKCFLAHSLSMMSPNEILNLKFSRRNKENLKTTHPCIFRRVRVLKQSPNIFLPAAPQASTPGIRAVSLRQPPRHFIHIILSMLRLWLRIIVCQV